MSDGRKIPFNYTSADDSQIIRLLIGDAGYNRLQKSRLLQTAGPAARPLMRFFGDLFMLQRNPFIRNDLIESQNRHQQFFETVHLDLEMVKHAASDHPKPRPVMNDLKHCLDEADAGIRQIRDGQRLLLRRLAHVVGRNNIFTDPFTLNAHVTDATNWRLCLPVAVVRPTREDQVPGTIEAIARAGFKVISRGGGTGLTGGSVPVENNCVIVNTEQLNHIHGIETCTIAAPGQDRRQAPMIHLEAGVITNAAMDYAQQQGLVFATDPTSAWACTIGGNIAENAGGKTAVLWGTAIDNLFDFTIAMPDGRSYILRHAELEALSERISACVRCGRCKTPCCVFHPRENLFYHPRNKNLAVVALIEAILYQTQRFRTTGFDALRYLGQVADHCTICHKCQPPCPVDIDSGAVSILERQILSSRRYRKTAPATRAALTYLDSRSPVFNAVIRPAALWAGSRLQRTGAALRRFLPGSAGHDSSHKFGILGSPMPAIPAGTLFGRLPACGTDQAVVIEPDGPVKQTAFYFPGCGSERLYSPVSLAAIHILVQTSTRVILPPPFLCCGFPARVNAKTDMHRRQSMRTAIILHQIREYFGHLDFSAVAVSCGTCRESLADMDVASIFNCMLTDVSQLALESGLDANISPGRLYHAPCHDSLDGRGEDMLTGLGQPVAAVSHCYGEAGTLALSRPDIAAAMRGRKRDAFKSVLD